LTHSPNWNKALVTMLHWFRLEGGRRVVVNTDSHRASELGRNYLLARELLDLADFDVPGDLLHLQTRLSEPALF
jgi:hypothetical protein